MQFWNDINNTLKVKMIQAKSVVDKCFDAKPVKCVRTKKRGSHYRCKINNRLAILHLEADQLHIRQKYLEETMAYKSIKQVKLQERLWSIRVIVTTKVARLHFDFPSVHQATKLYEELIYKKVENR